MKTTNKMKHQIYLVKGFSPRPDYPTISRKIIASSPGVARKVASRLFRGLPYCVSKPILKQQIGSPLGLPIEPN